MGFKDLFVVSENKEETKKEEKKKERVSFPVETPTQQTSPAFPTFQSNVSTQTLQPAQLGASQEALKKAFDLYNTGFEKLNQPGYDFFEFFRGIQQTNGFDNPSAFNMAFIMGKSTSPNVSKELLAQQADFYVTKLVERYNEFVNTGRNKKNELLTNKTVETNTLSSELEGLRAQFESIKVQIQDRETKLTTIDAKYQPQITDIENLLVANDTVKQQFVDMIQKVKQGILTHIQ